MPSVHHFEIHFSRGQSTTLNTTTERPLISNKTCISSSVIGVPAGRHSQLGPTLAALHSLNDLNLLPPSSTQVLLESMLVAVSSFLLCNYRFNPNLWQLVSSISGTKIEVSPIEIPRKSLFPRTRFSLVCSLSMSFETNGPKIRVPRIKLAPEKSPSNEIRLYRLPSNLSRPRQKDAGFEFPTSENFLESPFRWNPGVSVA